MSTTKPKNLGPHQYCGCEPCCLCNGLDWCQVTRKVNFMHGPACTEPSCPNSQMPEGGTKCFPHSLGLPLTWLNCPVCNLSDHVIRDDQGPGANCLRCNRRVRIRPEHWTIVSAWEIKRRGVRDRRKLN